MKKQLLLIIDTETTGFFGNKLQSDSRIVSLAAEAVQLSFDPSSSLTFSLIGDSFYSLARPVVWAKDSDKALAFNGLSRTEIEKNGLPPKTLWTKFEQWIEEVSQKSEVEEKEVYWLAYSSAFDRKAISLLLLDSGFKIKETVNWPDWIFGRQKAKNGCLLSAVRSSLKHVENHKLQTVHQYLGLPFRGDAHNALNDVRMARDIVEALVKMEVQSQET